MDLPRSSPHRSFLVASVLALCMLTFAFGQVQYAALAAVWLGVLAVALVQSRRALSGLTARRRVVGAAFEGDGVPVHVTLVNRSGRGVRFVELIDRFGPALASMSLVPDAGPLPARSRRALSYEGQCNRLWGTYGVGPLRIAAWDGLGLFRASKVLPQQSEFSTYPRVHEVAGLAQLGGRPTFSVEDARLDRPGMSHVYLGVREYAVGDDPRRVHWRATARTGQLMVREHEVDLVPYLTLFLDLNKEHRAGLGRKSTLEYVVRTGASLLASAVRQGLYVQLFAEASHPVAVPPGRGEAHLMAALDSLIRLRQDGVRAISDVVADELAALPRSSTAVVLVSTAAPEPAEIREIVERLASRAVRPAFVFVDHRSFAAIDARADDADELARRRESVQELLASHRAPAAFLGVEDELEQRLKQGLFES